MQKFLNTLWEFNGGKEDKDNSIQKTLKVCKVFKVKRLKTPKPDVPLKKLGRFHSLKMHQGHPNQMNLKMHQGHQGLLMIQVR